MTFSPEVMLGDVAKFIRGINFKPTDVVPNGTIGSIGCMRTKNVQDELDCEDVWGIPKEFVRRNEQMLCEGDILVSSANSWNLVGKCSWVPKLDWPASFGGFVSVLRADSNKVVPRFLYRWFASNRTQALLRSFGQKTTNISNLNIERCLNLKLRLPPIPEQRRIAAILDQADALRAKRREALAQLDSLTQSIFIEMFGKQSHTQTAQLGKIVSMKRGPFGGALKKEIFVLEGPMVYEQRNAIQDDCLTGRYFISEAKFREMEDFSVLPNDLIVSCSGTIGKVAIAPDNAPKGVINQALLRIRVDGNTALPIFLKHVLESQEIQNKLTGLSHGTGLQNFPPIAEVKALEIPLPSIERQKAFESQLRVVAQQSDVVNESARELGALFDSLQHRAFRGEL